MPRSKKSKKTADNASPAVEAGQVQEQVESQEVGNSEEQTPATIVESSEEQLFASQEGTQEAVTEQTEEKPAPKPPRASKRPYIADVEVMLNAGSHTKPQILALIMAKYPAVSKGGASTFITDLCNIKYNHFKPRAVIKLADSKLQFADMVRAATDMPEPEAQPTDEPPEQPAE